MNREIARAAAAAADERRRQQNENANVYRPNSSRQPTTKADEPFVRRAAGRRDTAHAAAAAACARNERRQKEKSTLSAAINSQSNKIVRVRQEAVPMGMAAAAAAASLAMKQRVSYGEDWMNRSGETFLASLIKSFDWDAVESRCQTNAGEAQHMDSRYGSGTCTALHLICSIGSAPFSAIQAVLNGYEAAARTRNQQGETPLHLVCKNSQRSRQEVSLLVHHCRESVSILDKNGKSPLHVACESNAWLPVLQELVLANPNMLLQRDSTGKTPLGSLWTAYIKTIHGGLAIHSVSKRGVAVPHSHDDDQEEGEGGGEGRGGEHFMRFYNKLKFLTLQAQRVQEQQQQHQDPKPPDTKSSFENGGDDCSEEMLLGHAVLRVKGCPRLFLLIVLQVEPQLCRAVDHNTGNYILHEIASCRPVMKCDVDICTILLREYKTAAQLPNKDGRLPLHLALEKNATSGNRILSGGRTWSQSNNKEGGEMMKIAYACPDALGLLDPKYRLYPFMLAAYGGSGGLGALNTTFGLVLAKPEVVTRCCF